SPNNALLHYNTGLIYAQLENYHKAYFHFLRAFHLNSADYLSAFLSAIAIKRPLLKARLAPSKSFFASESKRNSPSSITPKV
ncbi:hypothetical protein JT180_02415, partial [Helicobacter pylori]|nr:hypothetical protein [Helicobacter pylori]